MPKANLTEDRIRKLEPGIRLFFLWDQKVSGFGVRVTPAGAKSYVIGYRQSGKWKVATIGKVGDPPRLDEARREAQARLVDAQRGVDLVAERQARREAPTLSDLLDRWMREHSEPNNKPATVAKNRALIRRNVEGALGDTIAAEVGIGDVEKLKTRLRAKPVEFNRTLALLRAAFNFAVKRSLVPLNPCSAVTPYKEQPRDRILSADELRRIAGALAEMEAEGWNPYSIAAIRLLALTGWRISEVLGLRWEDVRPDRGEALLVDTKTGRRWASVSTQALALLDGLEARGAYVFHGRSREGNLGYNAVSDALHRACEVAKVPDVTPHTFRASAATAMVEAGADLFALRDSFGWKGLAMPNRYVKRAQQSAREAIAKHGARVAAIMSGEPEAETVDLKKRGR